ncbi:MAG: radical SAM protein [Moorellaceae bacterium]
MSHTSPDWIRISTAAAITLGLANGSFHRGARLRGLNLLLTYEEPCSGRCAYCGLAGNRQPLGDTSFIRVDWPVVPLDEVIARVKADGRGLERVCVAMQTHRRAMGDLLYIAGRIKQETDLLLSALITPTCVGKKEFEELQAVGVDMVGIAVDCATKGLFEALRGRGAGGPHRWERYWAGVEEAVSVLGAGRVGIHLIVGLGETEHEAVAAIQRAQDLGARTHLFSFFPEPGSLMQEQRPPSLGRYRRVQLARYLINEGLARLEGMRFDSGGRLVDFGIGQELLDETISTGLPFMTSGCPGKDGCTVACNRPYGNERPSGCIRNFPFPPEERDLFFIRRQLWA